MPPTDLKHSSSLTSSLLYDFLRLLRPYQWLKNLLLFSPLFFSGQLLEKSFLITCAGFGLFCLVSSLGYIMNDWMDRETDRHHLVKKNRPFAAKSLNGYHGIVLSGFLTAIIVLVLIVVPLSIEFIIFLTLYCGLTFSYSLYFKHVVILEIFSIAAGFVLRVLAGGAVAGIEISSWLFLTVFFIAMMIAVAKRINEINELGIDKAILHRRSQTEYTISYLYHVLWGCGSISLVVYSLYAVEHGALIMYSVIPATYGIFRFIYLTDQGSSHDPIKTLFSDHQLILATTIFLLFLALVIY